MRAIMLKATNRNRFGVIITVIAFILLWGSLFGCGDNNDANENDVGVDADTTTDVDGDEDSDADADAAAELREHGEPCESCAEMPGSTAVCDICEGNRCHSPSTVGADPYCVLQCHSQEDCDDLGWTCDGSHCLDEDRL